MPKYNNNEFCNSENKNEQNKKWEEAVVLGVWDTPPEEIGRDACGKIHFNYHLWPHKEMTFTSPDMKACTWRPWMVVGHVACTSTVSDNFAMEVADCRGLIAERDCIADDGEGIARIHKIVYPAYDCAQYSNYYRDPETNEGYCTPLPVVCGGYVLGRDLSLPPLGYLGHIGIGTGQALKPNSVLEVLRQQPVIQMNTIDSFQQASSYWGYRHFKFFEQLEPKITEEKAKDIVTVGWKQSAYFPEYTLGWDWQPGGEKFVYLFDSNNSQWESIYGWTQARFRCDSFVYFCYAAGINYQIVNYGPPNGPRTIFSAIPDVRYVSTYSNSTTIDSIDSTFELLENRITETKNSYEQLDALSYQYVSDNKINRSEKITKLWSLALRYQENIELFDYLIDVLRSLNPVELTANILESFNSQNHVDNQIKLLSTLADVAQQKDSSAIKSRSLARKVKAIHEFFEDILLCHPNQKIVQEAIIHYSKIALARQAAKILPRAFDRSHLLHPVKDYAPLSRRQWFEIQLRMAIQTHSSQEEFLLPLLKASAHLDDEDKLYFNNRLYQMIADSPESLFSINIQDKMVGYIKSQKKYVQSATIKFIASQENSMPELQSNWEASLNKLENIADLDGSLRPPEVSSASRSAQPFWFSLLQYKQLSPTLIEKVRTLQITSVENSQALVAIENEESPRSEPKPNSLTAPYQSISDKLLNPLLTSIIIVEAAKNIYGFFSNNHYQSRDKKNVENIKERQIISILQNNLYGRLYLSLTANDLDTKEDIKLALENLSTHELITLAKLHTLSTNQAKKHIGISTEIRGILLALAQDAYSFARKKGIALPAAYTPSKSIFFQTTQYKVPTTQVDKTSHQKSLVC